MQKAFLHVDLDAFFASVEILDHPEWKNKPVIIGGKPEDRRSVVSTASYEARKYGVHSAMPSSQAARLCPQGIFVHPRMERYLEMSEKVMMIFEDFSPDIHQISIDEAFINLTGTEKLFGPPEQTALKIKERVFKETGLTVSAGLAPTKYLAKIASEVNKPDGFFQITEGEEENFMLSLPLKKVWGVGEKTLELLNRNGIKTTRDIYSKPLNLLTVLFGQSTGTFLYNAVRGKEDETFNRETKTHSISAEHTCPFDLTTPEAIDTTLLHLSLAVMYRLRKEHRYSSTVSVKIRYSDFTTVSVQESSDRIISSIDDLYERAKKLFYKKADSSKGIRLLGIAVLKTEDESVPRQAELFDFGEEKKRKAEEAVFKAQNKIPGIKITRARLLNTHKTKLIIPFAAVFMLLAPSQKIKAETTVTNRNADGAGAIVFDTSKLPPEMNGQGKSLFNWNEDDKNVEFIAEGWWKSFFTGGFITSTGKTSDTTASLITPVLTSEVDLSVWFLLNRHWYFQAAFADGFDRNTVAAGWRGEAALKEARIANRGINFPSGYSVDSFNRGIGGGDNLNPGVRLNFSGSDWKSDFALRWESVEAKSKSWYGKNSVTEETIALNSYLTGFQYIFPSKEAVRSIKNIYVESSSGTFTDSKGRRYKKLDSSAYLLSASMYSVFLSKDAKAYSSDGICPAVAVEYDSSYNPETELGDYGTAENPGSLFLGETQKLFSKHNLINYSLINEGGKGKDEINSNTVWYIQYPSRFSPYAACLRYDGRILSSGECSVSSSNTGISNSNYSAVLGNDEYSSVLNDFFYASHKYADVFYKNTDSLLSPEYRFPFAKDEPSVYLGGTASSDLAVVIKSYTAVSRFDIGTNAIPGTITVTKNSVQDTNAVYDKENGTLTLSGTVSASDKITAVWYEDSSDSSQGTLAAAFGIQKQFSPYTSADFSMAARWTFITDSDDQNFSCDCPGYITFASLFNRNKDSLSFSNTAGVTVETKNTQGKYLIWNLENESSEYSCFSKNSGIALSSLILPVLNERDFSVPSQTLKESNRAESLTPEGVILSSQKGYVIPVEWDFTDFEQDCSSDSPYWAGCSLKLSGTSGILGGAGAFSIKLKSFDTSITDYCVYLQLGTRADEDITLEDSTLVSTWRIDTSDGLKSDVKAGFNPSLEGWQEVTVKINETDRQRLCSYTDARIIITGTSNTLAGKLYAGEYKADSFEFNIEAENESSYFTWNKNVSSSDFEQVFELNNTSPETFTITRWFEEKEWEDWENLNLELTLNGSFSDSDYAKIYLDRPQKDGSSKTAVELTLYKEDLTSLSSASSKKIKINLFKKSTNAGTLTLKNTKIIPVRFVLELHTSSPLTLSLKNLYWSDNHAYTLLQDKTALDWKLSSPVVSASGYKIIKDASFNAESLVQTAVKKETAFSDDKSLTGKTSAHITLTDFYICADAVRSGESSGAFSQAGHTLKTDSPLFKVFSFKEKLELDDDENTVEKENSLSMSFSKLNIPLTFTAEGQASSTPSVLNQNLSSTLSFNPAFINIKGNVWAKQKMISSVEGIDEYSTSYYAQSWKSITELTFDKGNPLSTSRTTGAKLQLSTDKTILKAKPSWKIELSENYKNTASTTSTHSVSQLFSLPFSFKKSSITLSWQKSAGGVKETNQGGSYREDINTLSQSLSEKSWYFKELPFYDLFDSKLKDSVLSDSTMNEDSVHSLYYTSLYTASWKRRFNGNLKDFFLPSNASLALERDIKTSSSVNDLYQFKCILGFNALNVFGSKSALHLTDLFSQDEYITSITAALKYSGESKKRQAVLISIYQQDIFYLAEKDTLKTGFEVTLEDENNYSTKGTLIWSRKGNFSLLESPVKYMYKKYSRTKDSLTRTDSLNLVYSRTKSTSSSLKIHHNYEYSHKLDLKINSIAELNTALGLSYDCIVNSLTTLYATASIGATLKF
jgi:DNA polymerase-4